MRPSFLDGVDLRVEGFPVYANAEPAQLEARELAAAVHPIDMVERYAQICGGFADLKPPPRID